MKGFTLIELLVVVLIIGILASIALPQYQKAVEKARAAEAIQLLKYMYRQGELCELSNGPTACGITNEELGIEMPGGMNCHITNHEQEVCCNQFWCYANNSLLWGDNWVSSSPKTPIATRANNTNPAHPDDMDIKYWLEMEDTGRIWCFDYQEQWCNMFRGNGRPIN